MTAPPAGALEACLALLEKATPGEWTNNLHDDAHMGRLYGGRQGDGTHPVLCKTWNSPSDEGLHCYVGISQLQGMHNSAAIAAAVNLLKDHGPALLAALRLLLRLREWRPIESAPKNMSVLVARHGIEPVIAEYVMYTSAGYSWCCGYREMRDRPTHWMPLPAPPTADDLARVLEEGE